MGEVVRFENVESLVEQKRTDMMTSNEIQELGEVAAKVRVKNDFERIAQEEREKRLKTWEKQLDNDLYEMYLKQKREEETKRHKYNMAQINSNAKHDQMLDKREKMKEKYGYLYEIDKDSKGTPLMDANGKPIYKDFSYSEVVNRLRTLARNFDRLDTSFKNILKIIFFSGVAFGVIYLLKYFSII